MNVFLQVNKINPFIRKLAQHVATFIRSTRSPSGKPKQSAFRDHQDYKAMAELPDYLLKDTGVSRAELNLKLNKPWWWS